MFFLREAQATKRLIFTVSPIKSSNFKSQFIKIERKNLSTTTNKSEKSNEPKQEGNPSWTSIVIAFTGYLALIEAVRAYHESRKQTEEMIKQTKIQQFEWGFESLRKYFGFTKINRRHGKDYDEQAKEYESAKASIFMISHSGQRAIHRERNDKKGSNPVRKVIDSKIKGDVKIKLLMPSEKGIEKIGRSNLEASTSEKILNDLARDKKTIIEHVKGTFKETIQEIETDAFQNKKSFECRILPDDIILPFVGEFIDGKKINITHIGYSEMVPTDGMSITFTIQPQNANNGQDIFTLYKNTFNTLWEKSSTCENYFKEKKLELHGNLKEGEAQAENPASTVETSSAPPPNKLISDSQVCPK